MTTPEELDKRVGMAWVRIGRACDDGGRDAEAALDLLKEFTRLRADNDRMSHEYAMWLAELEGPTPQELLEKIKLYEDSLAMATPWPLPDVLEVLTNAADHLLLDHDCDQHGYERVAAARDAGKKILERFKR